MNNKFIKILLLSFLFLGQSVYATESLSAKRIDPQAKAKAQVAFEQANTYAKQGNYAKALEYLKTSYEYEPADGTTYNIALMYDKLQNYESAIQWYEKAFTMGKTNGGVNLGLLYEEKLKDIPNALKWYEKAIKKGNFGAYDNISLIYHDIKKDNLTASAYYIATIDKSYTKKEILDFLRDDWKIDEDTLKKAYELQKTLVPNPYTGGID